MKKQKTEKQKTKNNFPKTVIYYPIQITVCTEARAECPAQPLSINRER